MILPFCLDGSKLSVGVIEEHRPFLGGDTHNAPRGFRTPDEDPAAARVTPIA